MQPPQVNIDVEVIDPQAQKELMQERLQAFGSSMAQQRDEWVRARYSYGVD